MTLAAWVEFMLCPNRGPVAAGSPAQPGDDKKCGSSVGDRTRGERVARHPRVVASPVLTRYRDRSESAGGDAAGAGAQREARAPRTTERFPPGRFAARTAAYLAARP